MIKIGGLQKNTLIDFPGCVAATVFLCGCNFRCPWCYSREIVLPEEIKKQPEISEKKFFDFLEKRQSLLEGVVICGGEPTMNQDLPVFIKKIKKMGFFVKLDTNGSNPAMLKRLIGARLINYVAMDVKLPKEKYRKNVVMSECWNDKMLNNIQKSIDILKKGKVDYEFRTTVVPTVHTEEDIIEIAKWLNGSKRYFLQNFRPEKTIDPAFTKIKPYPENYLLEIKKEVSPFFETCQIR